MDHLRSIRFGFLILAVCTRVSAQNWTVDPTPPDPGPNSSVLIEAESYADCCSNNSPNPFPCVDRPPPGPGLGSCPPFIWFPHVGWAAYPEWEDDREGPAEVFSPNFTPIFGTPRADLGVGVSTYPAEDFGPFPHGAKSEARGFVVADGLGSRNLYLAGMSEVLNTANDDDDHFERGCIESTADLSFHVRNPIGPYKIFYFWRAEGSVDIHHECSDLANAGPCGARGLPATEDPARSLNHIELDVDGNGPGVLYDADVDNFGGTGPAYIQTDNDIIGVPGGNALPIHLTIHQIVSFTQQYPSAIEATSATAHYQLWLSLIYYGFNPGEPMTDYMREISDTGNSEQGPSYCMKMGRYEITNQQYADFLNAAELDGGATDVSSYMAFQADGSVFVPDGTPMVRTSNATAGARIKYDASAPVGARYTVDAPPNSDPRSYQDHPVVFVSWYGAVKFCNWLTLERGLGAAERCYTEGSTAGDWHPVTIPTADWSFRDLSFAERQALVSGYSGFRLPMDNLLGLTGWIGNQNNGYNEWYKAAAFDPNGPPFPGVGPGGETVPGYHWTYGFGRDLIGDSDANYNQSTDPFDDDDAFVGLYDGTLYNPSNVGQVGNQSQFQSSADTNAWGLYDMSGNVSEWVQDQGATPTGRAYRGGSWSDASSRLAASYRDVAAADDCAADRGFRVMQSTCTVCLNCPGDLNGDGKVDGADIQKFTACLLGGNPAAAGCLCADMDGNGSLNAADLQAFIARLMAASSNCP